MSKKKVLLRGVFINRDTNGEGVLKVGTTLIRVSTVMGILYMAQLISENLEKKKSEWHKTILKEENIATLESEKKRLSSRKMKLYSDYRSEVLDKEGYMEELEKTTSRISEITLQIAELENEIAVAKKKCDEATEKEMEVNEIAALQDFDKIQLSKIIEKVFIYEPGRMEINWKMDDIFYKEEKA